MVYAAHDVRLDRPVAVKLLRGDLAADRAGRFPPGGSVHSLKYVVGRHWLRSHARLVEVAAVILGVVIYLVTR